MLRGMFLEFSNSRGKKVKMVLGQADFVEKVVSVWKALNVVQAETISSFLPLPAALGPARPMQCFDITTYPQSREVEQPWLKRTFQTLKKVLQSSRCCGWPCGTTRGLGSLCKAALA